jgi:hypothetical protein
MPPASAYQPQESRRAPGVADLLPLGQYASYAYKWYLGSFIAGIPRRS